MAFVFIIITSVWITHYGRWTREAWLFPTNYVGAYERDMTFTGDALWGMAATKAMTRGEIWPIAPKYPTSFGAPFRANWNDFPSIEEGTNAWWALLVWCCGLVAGSMLVMLLGQLLAAGVFYGVCRYLGYNHWISGALGVLFALSRYAFWRNVANLSLTYYWHLPLGFLVLYWCLTLPPQQPTRRKLIAAAATAIIFGCQSAYFSAMFLQLLGWAALYRLVLFKTWRALVLPAVIGATTVATVIVMDIDTLYSRVADGRNPAAAERNYGGLERYALRPVEFILPRSHSFKPFEDWANQNYFQTTMIPGEEGSAYFGLVALVGLVTLTLVAGKAIANQQLSQLPVHFWGIVAVLAFALTGGLNGVAGLFGFWLLRASNRYSIFIFAIALLFLARQMSRLFSGSRSTIYAAPVSVLLLGIGIFDQVPPRTEAIERRARDVFFSEEALVREIEGRVGPGAMLFQLPVYDFPEGPLIGEMTDYEHFRPYLHSRQLRYSYGNTKGRPRDAWQHEVEAAGPSVLVAALERYGFSGVLIDRAAFGDRAKGLIEAFRALGKSRELAAAGDWVCLGLNPVRKPFMPPEFSPGFYNLEATGWRWSSGNATLILRNPNSDQQDVNLSFQLATLRQRYVRVRLGQTIIFEGLLQPGGFYPVNLRLKLASGETRLEFETDRPGDLLTKADSRRFAFSLTEFRFE